MGLRQMAVIEGWPLDWMGLHVGFDCISICRLCMVVLSMSMLQKCFFGCSGCTHVESVFANEEQVEVGT